MWSRLMHSSGYEEVVSVQWSHLKQLQRCWMITVTAQHSAAQHCAAQHWCQFTLTHACLGDVTELAQVSNYTPDPAVTRVSDVKNCDITFACVEKLINKMLAKEAWTSCHQAVLFLAVCGHRGMDRGAEVVQAGAELIDSRESAVVSYSFLPFLRSSTSSSKLGGRSASGG